jgi:hypothetical protein
MRKTAALLTFAFAVLLHLLGAAGARADDFVGLTYDIAIPTGDLADYIGQVSWRGFTFEGRHFFRQNLSIGLALNYNVFHENTDALIRLENRDITGHQFRVVYSLPILATVHYYFVWDDEQLFDPFVGLGIGGYRLERRLDIGVYTVQDKNWHFGFAPELGAAYPLDFTKSVYASVKYNYAFEASGIGPYSYWGLNVGVAWRQ